MPQRSLSVYFSSPVPPLLRAKREDVIAVLLYLGLKIGSPVIEGKKPTTRHKRHVPHFF